MKITIRALAMILVLLMTLTVVACNNGDKDDPKETERETEREVEQQTEPELTEQEIEQLKMDMAASILEELAKHEQTTTSNSGGSSGKPGKEEDTTNYTDYIEGLLGALGGLEGNYDYSKVIGEVLDQYIGSNSTSEFIMGLIKSWMENQKNTNEQATKDPADSGSDNGTTPPGTGNALQEFVAQQTAEAISNAIADRLTEVVDGTLREAIYDSVYESMTQDNAFMESILGGLIQ